LAEVLTEGKPVFAGDSDEDTFRKICDRLETHAMSMDGFKSYKSLKVF
jgi:hypothetical protein